MPMQLTKSRQPLMWIAATITVVLCSVGIGAFAGRPHASFSNTGDPRPAAAETNQTLKAHTVQDEEGATSGLRIVGGTVADNEVENERGRTSNYEISLRSPLWSVDDRVKKAVDDAIRSSP